MIHTFRSGYRFGSPDPRDKVLTGPPLTEMVKAGSYGSLDHSIPQHTPISDQGRIGSCVANAVVDALEILLGVEDPLKVEQLSRMMVYWNARSYTRETDKDDGTFVRNAIDSLRTLGVCRESLWPYVTANVFAQPPLSAYKESLDNRISAYYTVPGSGTQRCDAIEQAVRADHPVVFAAPVTEEYVRYFGGDGRAWPRVRTWLDYHAQIVVGVRWDAGVRSFKVRNSWGPGWGDGGHTWFTEEYMGAPECNDFWVLTRSPALVF